MEVNEVITDAVESDVTPSRPVYYLPHKPIWKETSFSTKVRAVFDASERDVKDVSLNDCIITGSYLNPHWIDFLSRFRRSQVTVLADIDKHL